MYLLPTPAGAFQAVAAPAGNRMHRFLLALLAQDGKAEATESNLCRWSGMDDPGEAQDFARRLLELGWIQATLSAYKPPAAPFPEPLPTLLPALSREGRILLADTQGFYLHSHGFHHEAAEELSALSADVAGLHLRHQGVLNRNLPLSGSAWSLVNAAGHSQIGFWPMHMGPERFVLVIAGAPAFNRRQLVDLVYVLYRRFMPST